MATLVAKTNVLEYLIELESAVLEVDTAYRVDYCPVVIGSTILVSDEVAEIDLILVAVPRINIMGVETTGVHFRGEKTERKRDGEHVSFGVWDELVWSYIQAHCEEDVIEAIRSNEDGS